MQSGGLERQAGPELEAERRRSEQSILDRRLNDDGIPEMFVISVGHQAVSCDDIGDVHSAKSLCVKKKVLCRFRSLQVQFFCEE